MNKTILTEEQLQRGTPQDKIIEIKSVYKNGKTTVQPVRDPLTGWFKGIERLSEDDKKKKKFWAEAHHKFVLKEGVTFDLNNEEQVVIWEWVKHQPCLASSYEEAQVKSGAEFYIHRRHKEAVKSVTSKQTKLKAMRLVDEDKVENYSLRAKLLGIPMDGEDPLIIKNFLLDQADSNPARVLKIYEDSQLSLRLLLIKALEKGKVTIDPSGAYRYGHVLMGMSEDSVVSWMSSSDNKNTVNLLEREVNPDYFEKEGSAKKETPPALERN